MQAENPPVSYLRVTDILKPFSGYDHVDEIILERAAERGKKVHSICESIASGVGDWGIEPGLEGYIDSFKDWWKDGHEIIEMEKRFYCDDLRVTGQVDFILKDGDKTYICDLKTSSKENRSWSVQGNGYAYLALKAGHKIDGIQFIKLHRYGKPPKIFHYDINIDFFKKCVEVYKFFFCVRDSK